MSPEEILDIIDEHDQVVGAAPREEVYSRKLMHRIVHIHIFDEHGNMGLQLRSAECSYCPLHWSTSVGGHVQSGESPEQAAYREYQEELGVTSAVQFLGKDFYAGDGLKKLLVSFRAVTPQRFNIDRFAVKDFQFFSLEQIAAMIARGEKFHPELLFLLQRYNWSSRAASSDS